MYQFNLLKGDPELKRGRNNRDLYSEAAQILTSSRIHTGSVWSSTIVATAFPQVSLANTPRYYPGKTYKEARVLSRRALSALAELVAAEDVWHR